MRRRESISPPSRPRFQRRIDLTSCSLRQQRRRIVSRRRSVNALGLSRRFDDVPVTSALPLTADLRREDRHVRNVPKPELARLGGLSFLSNPGWLVAPVCPEASGATKPTISAWSFCDYSLIHPPQFLRTTYYRSSSRSSPRPPRQEVASCSMCRRDISSLRLPVRRRSCTFQ
jgi:hypothetical protein